MSIRNRQGEANLARLAMAVALALLVSATGCTVPLPGVPLPLPGGPATVYPPGAEVPDLSGRPETLTPEQRIAVSQAVNEAWKPLQTGDPAADAQALLDTIAKTPGFADAGLGGDGSVWARYADGLPITWIIAAKDEPTPAPTEPSTPIDPPAPKLASIPTSPDAALFELSSWHRVDITASISKMLSDAKYKPAVLDGQVKTLETQIKNMGVLLAVTHGGVAKTPTGKSVYILTTGEAWTDQDEDKNWLRRLGWLVPVVTLPEFTTRWAVSTLFVEKSWTFAENALIFIASCGVYATAEGRTFVDTLRNASIGNSATILGWDGSVNTYYNTHTAKKFFARILGDNSVDDEKIPRRPFTYKQVYDWMADFGEIEVSPGTATLTITYGPAGDGQLVPSIMHSAVIHPGKGASVPHAGERYLEIAGSFGPDPGPENRSVTVGDTPLEVYPDGWKETSIQAKLPQNSASPGSYGNVVVEVRGHPSNPAPLTQWTGYVSQVQVLKDTQKSGQVHIFCPVRLTADLHFFRGAPLTDPMTIFATKVETTGPCTYRIWGSWSYPGEKHNLSGSGQFQPDNNIIGGFQSFTHNKPKLNADNRGDKPITVGTTLAWVSNKTTGTHTITSSSGVTRRPMHADFSALGTYWHDRSFKLDSNYAAPTRVRDCNFNDVYVSCAETWNLTPKAPIPTKDTQA